MPRPPGKADFTGHQLAHALNRHLRPEPIRILSAQRVPSTFHARFSAVSRTYIYRLLLGCAHHSQIPVFERDLCWAPPGGPLDIAAMRAAAELLLGTHDFSSFRSPGGPAQPSPVRTLLQLRIRPGPGLLARHGPLGELEFWEVKVKGRSFLYRQCQAKLWTTNLRRDLVPKKYCFECAGWWGRWWPWVRAVCPPGTSRSCCSGRTRGRCRRTPWPRRGGCSWRPWSTGSKIWPSQKRNFLLSAENGKLVKLPQ
ncbi:tRNA pseudouridine synthase-like 1 isoform X2 [Oenanthe melanoleuca]|uniref:tRNA pseudouridine synthase-like 1 isoform X2 n=1 Tax=Oenanthe melanoleuca TaxID=2939378 RepID=UPI0024C0F94B|nr:tRNA pseudouridine synthase-like 1 isoform X2 [Oenanthe melanoleuca]